jgi:Fe-S-cluster containining protein
MGLLSPSPVPPRITPALCQRCGACCSAVVDGELLACRHLDATDGRYRCRIYSTRPPVCRDFDCLRTGEPSPAIADRVAAALATA